MNDKVYIVYQHINKINGKSYIGITCQKPSDRWGKDGNRYETCSAFWKAIQKYGWENFEHVVLRTGLTFEEACDLECQYIAEYRTTEREFGYNISKGGSLDSSELMTKKW